MSQVITLKNVFSPHECQRLINRLESIGFLEQLSGDQDRVIRARCVFEDRVLVDALWPRIQSSVGELTTFYGESFQPIPPANFPLSAYRAVGLNELLRCYKYRPGEQFRRHEDFAHEWHDGKRSFLTVLIYLNSDFTGGETWFEEEDLTVMPELGAATIFPHELIHAGCPVRTGLKYALRSDVVFAVP